MDGDGEHKSEVTTIQEWPSTLDAGLDLFFKTVRGLPEEELFGLLQAAWTESPEVALRIIFQTRDCRGGKGEKQIFYQAMQWLHGVQPESVEKNLSLIPFFGTWKDLLQLAVLLPALEKPVLTIIADQLRKDRQVLESGLGNVSLCAKWAPTEKHTFDNKKRYALKLAQLLFPKTKNAMVLYRKEYLVPLREKLRVTERYMCANDWGNIPYPSVPSRCMYLRRRTFIKHDVERFNRYLLDVMVGKATMNCSQVYPDELMVATRQCDVKSQMVAEAQWKGLIALLREQGSLKRSIALSDVSASMSSQYLRVSVSMGLLLSELCEGPFHNMVITFESDPHFHHVMGETFSQRVDSLLKAPWGGRTNFQAAMELILEMAKSENVPQHEMPDKLFVFSDMEFDAADSRYPSNHEAVVGKFREAGYEPPMIIYWNLRPGGVKFPAKADTPGVALLSGYSPSLMKVVMDGCELGIQPDENAETPSKLTEITPLDVLKNAIADERYDNIAL